MHKYSCNWHVHFHISFFTIIVFVKKLQLLRWNINFKKYNNIGTTIAKKIHKNAKNNLLLFLQIADLPSDISFSKTEFLTSQNKMLLQKQTAVISNSVIRQIPKEEQK